MIICCDKFGEKVREYKGSGLGYPVTPNAQFEWADDAWAVNGCCGGGCYVVIGMKYCPYCGTELDNREAQQVTQHEEEGT